MASCSIFFLPFSLCFFIDHHPVNSGLPEHMLCRETGRTAAGRGPCRECAKYANAAIDLGRDSKLADSAVAVKGMDCKHWVAVRVVVVVMVEEGLGRAGGERSRAAAFGPSEFGADQYCRYQREVWVRYSGWSEPLHTKTPLGWVMSQTDHW